jgi:hypothetical protein
VKGKLFSMSWPKTWKPKKSMPTESRSTIKLTKNQIA